MPGYYCQELETKLKRTRIEVISVKCRVVSSSESEAQHDRDHTDIDVLLSALGDLVSPADELRHKMNEGGAEILRAPFRPQKLRLSRMREYFSHIFKTKRSNKP